MFYPATTLAELRAALVVITQQYRHNKKPFMMMDGRHAVRSWGSNRGYYAHLAFLPHDRDPMTTIEFRDYIPTLYGRRMVGYKGGVYHVSPDYPVHVAPYGSSGTRLGGISVDDKVVRLIHWMDDDLNGIFSPRFAYATYNPDVVIDRDGRFDDENEVLYRVSL